MLPLVVSLTAHGALAAVLIAARIPQADSAPAELPERDVWIGETLEPPSPAPEVPPVDDATAPRVSDSDAPPVPAPRARVSERRSQQTIPKNDDETLAARILSYAPRRRELVESEPSEARPSDSRQTTGGMDETNDRARARGFAKAFTRALPAANSGDPIWNELAPGALGFVRIAVTVGDDGQVAESTILDKPRKPPIHLARLVERTMLLLQGGRFALSRAHEGTERLRVDVTLSERPVESGPLALGFEPPGDGSPGRAFFQLSTGRFVEAKVSIESR